MHHRQHSPHRVTLPLNHFYNQHSAPAPAIKSKQRTLLLISQHHSHLQRKYATEIANSRPTSHPLLHGAVGHFFHVLFCSTTSPFVRPLLLMKMLYDPPGWTKVSSCYLRYRRRPTLWNKCISFNFAMSPIVDYTNGTGDSKKAIVRR